MARNSQKILALVVFAVIIITALTLRAVEYFTVKTAEVKFGDREIKVLVADTIEKRFKGWSDRSSMGVYEGMYFIFPEKEIHSMVMRDMYFPLDIVWLDGNKITDIAQNLQPEPDKPESALTIFSNKTPGDGVLELPAGFVERYGVKVGDLVEIKM